MSEKRSKQLSRMADWWAHNVGGCPNGVGHAAHLSVCKMFKAAFMAGADAGRDEQNKAFIRLIEVWQKEERENADQG